MKKVDFDTIKTWYVQGEQGPDGLRYPSLDELAKKAHRNASSVRKTAAKEKWAELRDLFKSKTENLTLERKSLIMAGASAEFDSKVLDASRLGIQLINEVLNAIVTERPKGESIKETIEWVEDRNDSIKEMGKALNDYQKAGRLAFGETSEQGAPPSINIKVVSEKAKALTEGIITGDLSD